MYTLLLSLLASTALASPLIERQNTNGTATSTGATATSTSGGASNGTSAGAAQPVVTIYPQTESGEPITIRGKRDLLNVDSYLGIPFAAPPVGDLRFQAPQDATWSNGTDFDATSQPPACLQNSTTYGAYGESEDCLYLNVQTPRGANGTTASLPVMVWVYGGSFVTGAASFYPGIAISAQSQMTERPVVFVALNYRLGVFGFPQGDEAFAGGNGNPGLRDVQKGLEWVQEHIWAFGGDPDQVTVFGQSAGAILISLLYLQPDLNLFKSAIMQSGAQSTAPLGPTGTTWSEPYDFLIQSVGCSQNSTGNNYTSEYECLKALPAEDLFAGQAAVRAQPQYALNFVFAPSVDGAIVPDSPHTLLANGQFAKIPFISGNVKDEGTLFIPTPDEVPINTTQQAALVLASIQPNPPSTETLTQLLTEVYPNDPSIGAPYGTGNDTFGFPPEFKQLASVLGDGAFQANRRWFLEQANANGLTQTWSYLFEAVPPNAPPYLGSSHGSDVFYVFGLPQVAAYGLDIPQLALVGNYTPSDVALSRQLIDYWLNFAYYTDPSPSWVQSNLTSWPQYGSDLNLITFNTTNNGTVNDTIIPDTYRQDQMEFFLDRPDQFNYKRTLLK